MSFQFLSFYIFIDNFIFFWFWYQNGEYNIGLTIPSSYILVFQFYNLLLSNSGCILYDLKFCVLCIYGYNLKWSSFTWKKTAVYFKQEAMKSNSKINQGLTDHLNYILNEGVFTKIFSRLSEIAAQIHSTFPHTVS